MRPISRPFLTEDTIWTTALPDACNGNGTWQQGFRVGPLDLVLLRYALRVAGQIDQLAVTCLDRLPTKQPITICPYYISSSGKRLAHLAPSSHRHDLAYQATLTQLLSQCQPLLEEVAGREELLHVVEKMLGLNVGICSYGPTAADKCSIAL